MTAIVIISTICLAAVAFLIYFLIALCKESSAGACHVVRIPPDSYSPEVGTGELNPIGVAGLIPRQHRYQHLQYSDGGQEQPLLYGARLDLEGE